MFYGVTPHMNNLNEEVPYGVTPHMNNLNEKVLMGGQNVGHIICVY